MTDQGTAGLAGDLIEAGPQALTGSPEFAASYRLFARPDAREVEQMLARSEVAAYLRAYPGTVIETAGGCIAVYRPTDVWAPAQYPRRLDEVLALCAALRGEASPPHICTPARRGFPAEGKGDARIQR